MNKIKNRQRRQEVVQIQNKKMAMHEEGLGEFCWQKEITWNNKYGSIMLPTKEPMEKRSGPVTEYKSYK